MDWYDYQIGFNREHTLQLHHLATDKDSIHLRLWNDRGSVVDIWSGDGNTYLGVVTSYVDTDDDASYDGYPNVTRLLKDTIDPATVKHVMAKWMADIFPDSSILRDWSSGFDGIAFRSEYATHGSYTSIRLWAPAYQQSVSAHSLVSNIRSIDSMLQLRQHFSRLYDSLKPGRYAACRGYLGCFTKPAVELKEVKETYEQHKTYILNRLHDSSYYYPAGHTPTH